MDLTEEELELLEPHPDIHALFVHYNSLYFEEKLGACSGRRCCCCSGSASGDRAAEPFAASHHLCCSRVEQRAHDPVRRRVRVPEGRRLPHQAQRAAAQGAVVTF